MNQSKISSVECSFKSLTAPHLGDLIQSQNSLTFKLLKTVADFSQSLATLHDRFGHEIQMLVETFRKRNGELRKERLNCPNSLFQIWELFLQQVEVNSQQHGDISRDLGQTLGNGLIERVFHRKIQSKKIFSHKERIEAILLKSNELLGKCYEDYCQAYALALKDPAQYVNDYIASHNVYVHQLQATNGMVHAYQTKTLPKLLEELEECHLETSSSISSSLQSSSELIAEKSSEQTAGYQNLAGACKQANHRQDLAHLVKVLVSTPPSAVAHHNNHQDHQSESDSTTGHERNTIRYHQFQAANWQQSNQLDSLSQIDPKNLQIVPVFRNEIAPDYSQPPGQQQPKLEMDRASLEEKIEKFEERVEALSKLLVRSSESRLHNKVNELQEELSQRRFDLYVAQIHLSAVRSQLQLFEYNFRPNAMAQSGSQQPLNALDQVNTDDEQQQTQPQQQQQQQQQQQSPNDANTIRRSPQSAGAGGGSSGSSVVMAPPFGYRNKWIKAFKSLKETPPPMQKVADNDFQSGDLLAQSAGGQQQSGQTNSSQLDNQHFFQEYTFKKIASCDVCKDFLRGHMRQGVKCKLCKISCHNDCQMKAHGTIKCQQPKIKLLRRQKSAGELEVNLNFDADQNATDQNERIFSSKPDSIYSLIRQVLDAKKRGQHHAPTSLHGPNQNHDDHHHNQLGRSLLNPAGGNLAQSHLMNLSTGNLALANQNGKSVSTSALQNRPESSVDRWSVVMDLLAQSRQNNSEGSGGGGGKRHSKQLDKFKLAARSVGKQQRHHHSKQPTQTTGAEQQADYVMDSNVGAGSRPTAGRLPPGPSGTKQLETPSNANQPQQLLVHHTKSLPVGQLPQQPGSSGATIGQQQQPQQQQQQQQQQQLYEQSPLNVAMGRHSHGLQSLQPAYNEGPLAGPALSNPIPHTQQQPVPVDRNPYQLLDLSLQQQIQSTSAPHSPQRKRFNLRMKSFSLDSPESPIVGGGGGVGGSGGGMYSSGSQLGGTSGLANPQQHHHNDQHHYLSQQPQLSHQQQQHQFNGSYAVDSHHQMGPSSSTSADRTLQTGQRRPAAGPSGGGGYQQTRYDQTGNFYYHPASGNNNNSNNYAGHQAGASGVASAANAPATDEPPTSGGGGAIQHDSAAGYLNSYASNELLDARLYSTSSTTGDCTAALGFQSQQHRHSYHNPISTPAAAAYNYHDGRLAGRAAGDMGPDPFRPMPGDIASNRHCTSSSALNIHHIAGPSNTTTVPIKAAGQKQQQTASKQAAGAKSAKQQLAAGVVGAHPAANSNVGPNNSHHQLDQRNESSNNMSSANNSLSNHNTNCNNANSDNGDYYDLDVDSHKQQNQSQKSSVGSVAVGVGGGPIVGPSLSMPPLSTGALTMAPAGDTFVVLYDYAAQRGDEIQLAAGQLIQVLDTSERDWWKVRALDGSNRIGYFPSSYLAQLYPNERPLQVAQTIQVSNGETCDKLLRGQIVIHTGKQLNSFVTIRTIRSNASPSDAPQALVNYIQCPEKYLLEVMESR